MNINYQVRRHGILTRRDVADVLASISPTSPPESDYTRGYLDALFRLATGLSIAVNVEQTGTQIMEVTP